MIDEMKKGYKMKKKFAFSLMEVITLLFILSVVAASTIPLITKRTLNENHGWYACYHRVDDEGRVATGTSNTMREIRVENKTESTAQNMIDHEVSQCYFNFPTGNPRPKKYTITAIGAGANLSSRQREASLVEVDGAGTYEYRDPNTELRRHRVLSDIWGYLMSPVTINDIVSRHNNGNPYTESHTYSDGTTDNNYQTYPSGLYGSRFGVVKSRCNGNDWTFCTAVAGEYIRTEYRLNDSDPNEFQRLKIDIGVPNTWEISGSDIYPSEQANRPTSPSKMQTVISDAAENKIVVAQGGYIYQKSNPVTKIIVPVYDELACKQDGLQLCPQVNGCTMNDYRVCMDNGFITDSQFLTNMQGKYKMEDSSFWLTNRLIHTPGLFDGQPEYEAFMKIYNTKLPDSGNYKNRILAFGDPTLVYFTKINGNGSPFQNIVRPDGKSDWSFTINHTYYPSGTGSTYHEQNARPGMVFITW